MSIQNSNDKKAITSTSTLTSTPPGRSRALTSAIAQLATASNHLVVSVKIENPVLILIEDPTERGSGGLLAGMTAFICFNQDTEALGLSSRESLQVSANSLDLSILKNVEVTFYHFFLCVCRQYFLVIISFTCYYYFKKNTQTHTYIYVYTE